MNFIPVDILIAEIEKALKASELHRGEAVADGSRQTLYWIKDFITSLPSSPASSKSSEDEERLINTSISFLKDFADKGYENAVECIDWLKSKLNGTSTNAK